MGFYVGIDVSKFKHTVAIIDENAEISNGTSPRN